MYITPGAHSPNSFLCECSPEADSTRPENILGTLFSLNVPRRVVSDTRRAFPEINCLWMFSGNWFQTPGEHSRNLILWLFSGVWSHMCKLFSNSFRNCFRSFQNVAERDPNTTKLGPRRNAVEMAFVPSLFACSPEGRSRHREIVDRIVVWMFFERCYIYIYIALENCTSRTQCCVYIYI